MPGITAAYNGMINLLGFGEVPQKPQVQLANLNDLDLIPDPKNWAHVPATLLPKVTDKEVRTDVQDIESRWKAREQRRGWICWTGRNIPLLYRCTKWTKLPDWLASKWDPTFEEQANKFLEAIREKKPLRIPGDKDIFRHPLLLMTCMQHCLDDVQRDPNFWTNTDRAKDLSDALKQLRTVFDEAIDLVALKNGEDNEYYRYVLSLKVPFLLMTYRCIYLSGMRVEQEALQNAQARRNQLQTEIALCNNEYATYNLDCNDASWFNLSKPIHYFYHGTYTERWKTKIRLEAKQKELRDLNKKIEELQPRVNGEENAVKAYSVQKLDGVFSDLGNVMLDCMAVIQDLGNRFKNLDTLYSEEKILNPKDYEDQKKELVDRKEELKANWSRQTLPSNWFLNFRAGLVEKKERRLKDLRKPMDDWLKQLKNQEKLLKDEFKNLTRECFGATFQINEAFLAQTTYSLGTLFLRAEDMGVEVFNDEIKKVVNCTVLGKINKSLNDLDRNQANSLQAVKEAVQAVRERELTVAIDKGATERNSNVVYLVKHAHDGLKAELEAREMDERVRIAHSDAARDIALFNTANTDYARALTTHADAIRNGLGAAAVALAQGAVNAAQVLRDQAAATAWGSIKGFEDLYTDDVKNRYNNALSLYQECFQCSDNGSKINGYLKDLFKKAKDLNKKLQKNGFDTHKRTLETNERQWKTDTEGYARTLLNAGYPR